MNLQSDEQAFNCSSEEIEQLQKLASSTTVGIWRIKRAKALLGALQGISPERLMFQIRMIREMITNDPNPFRNRIASQMCSTFNLYGHNGKPRTSLAVDILKRMAMYNLISIPFRGSGKRIGPAPPSKIVLPPQQIEEITSLKFVSLSGILVQKPDLILPWVKVPNLASSILGTIGRRVGQDWKTRYNSRPVLMESLIVEI